MRRAAWVAGGAAVLLALGAVGTADAPLPVLGPPCTVAGEGRSVEQAQAVAATVTAPGSVTCRVERADELGEVEGPRGLTPRAEAVLAGLEAAFGPQSLGGFAPGGVRSGHIPGSAHYEGRAVDVFFRPVTPEGKARGWALAHWLVAHADRYAVATVIFDRQVWTARRSSEGWRPYRHPSGLDDPIRAHEDHVHVDVVG
jgi:hypothetical protein